MLVDITSERGSDSDSEMNIAMVAIQKQTVNTNVLQFHRYMRRNSKLVPFPFLKVLTSYYGYWFCFLLQNTNPNNEEGTSARQDEGSLLHIVASFPANFTADIIDQRMSSCMVLLKMHMKSLRDNKSCARLLPDVTQNNDEGKKKVGFYAMQKALL